MCRYFTYLTIKNDQNVFLKEYYFGQIQQIVFGHRIICDSILVIHNGKLSKIFGHQRIIECGDFFNDFAVKLQPKCPNVALLMIYVCFLRWDSTIKQYLGENIILWLNK